MILFKVNVNDSDRGHHGASHQSTIKRSSLVSTSQWISLALCKGGIATPGDCIWSDFEDLKNIKAYRCDQRGVAWCHWKLCRYPSPSGWSCPGGIWRFWAWLHSRSRDHWTLQMRKCRPKKSLHQCDPRYEDPEKLIYCCLIDSWYHGHILVGVKDILHQSFILAQELCHGHNELGHETFLEEFWSKIRLNPDGRHL